MQSHFFHMPSMISHVLACVADPRFVSFLFISHFYLFSFTVYLFSVRHINFHTVVTAEGKNHCTHAQSRVLLRVDFQSPHRFMTAKLLDNFDYSATSPMIFQDESGDIDTEPSYSCDVEIDDGIIAKAISSPLFIHEREEPANLRQACHSHEERLLAQSFFAHAGTVRPVNEPSSSQKRK